MELLPKTEDGLCLSALLLEWTENSPENATEILQRILFMYSCQIVNEDTFISSLYGQNVVNDPPVELRQHLTTGQLRVQHAIGISLSKKCIRELVVALEWSGNGAVLAEIYKWAEQVSKQDVQNEPPMDLAPAKVQKSLSDVFSLVSSSVPALKPRDRYIDLLDPKENPVTALEVCNDKIIIGFSSGQVNTYNIMDLQCETLLRYCQDRAKVTLLQCTCTEIIAAYSYGSICVWKIESGKLLQTLIGHSQTIYEEVTCLRWRKPYLVAGKSNEKIQIWQQTDGNAGFASLGQWDSNVKNVNQVDLYLDYVIVKGNYSDDKLVFHGPPRGAPHSAHNVNVFHFNGNPVRTIGDNWQTHEIVVHDGHLIGAGADKALRVWDVRTGHLLVQLDGHQSRVQRMAAMSDFIISGDHFGEIIVWNLEAALKGELALVMRINDSDWPRRRSRTSTMHQGIRGRIFLGRNWLLTWSGDIIKVTDFL